MTLPAGVVFDHPTPPALASHLLKERGEWWSAGAGSRVPRRLRSRSRSSAWPAATPAASTPPAGCGSSSPRAPTASPSSPMTAAGTSSASMTPTPSTRARAIPARAASSPTPPASIPPSSGSARARHWRWTPSSGCCWKRPGRRSRMWGSTPSRCAAVETGVFAGAHPEQLRRPRGAGGGLRR